MEWIRETQERCGAAAAAAAGGVARESRERVRLLAQLADGLVEKGHPHAVQIKEWVAAVDARLLTYLLTSLPHGIYMLSRLNDNHLHCT